MKKILVTLLLFSTSIITSIAQNRSLDSLFDAGNYEACLQYISRNTAVDLSMKKVECLIRLNRLVEAENILIKHKETLPEILANKALLIGQVYLNKGFLNEAITAFEEAEKRFQTQRDAFKLSEVYSQMGMANWSEGNLEAALTFLHKALSIRISTYGEKHIYTASIYNNIGLVEDSRSNHEEAIKNYHLYQDAYIQKYGINHPAVATGFNNLGLVAKEEKNYKEALQLVQQSLSIRSIIYGENHSNTAFCIVTKGEIFNEMHANDSAIFYFNKALIIYQKLYDEHHPEIAALYNSLASANVANGRYKAALQLYQKALFANSNSFVSVQKWDKNPRAEDYRNPNIMLYTLLGKTEVLYKLYTEKSLNISHLKYALLAIQAADSLVDISRQLKADKNDKLGLGKIASEIYEHAIAISFKLADVTLQPGKYLNLAFYYSEKNKAATLMGAIAETDAKKFAGIPEALLLLENEIKINLNYFENIQATTPSHENHDSLFVYKNRYAALIKDLESKYPAYYQLKYAVNVPEVNEVSKLVDNNGLVLSYALSDKFQKLYVFTIGADNYFKAKEYTLDGYFYKNLNALKNGISFKDEEIFKLYAEKVYEQLFPFSIPSKIKQLTIVPDGKLCLLPFELLIRPGSKAQAFENMPYMIRDYAISYQFSVSLFAKENTVHATNNRKMLICAPVYFKNLNNDPDRIYLSDLKGTVDEMNALQHAADSNHIETLCLKEINANETKLKSLHLSDYTYLHFATHGTVNEEHPELSKIYLYESNASDKEDGSLSAGEIYNLQLKADMVTLSACETGKGKLTKGEGVVGLTRSLVYAGAKNIIVSHWKVSDGATAFLMINFYKKALATTNNFAADLQQAKLDLIQSKTFSAPYYWAAFVLMGK